MREDILVIAIAGVDVGPAKKLAPPSGRRQLEYHTGHRPQRKPFRLQTAAESGEPSVEVLRDPAPAAARDAAVHNGDRSGYWSG